MAKKKNPAAVALAKRRLIKLTPEQRRAIASTGGSNAWKDIPAKERSRIMSERRRGKSH